jgi:hypothetical protein
MKHFDISLLLVVSQKVMPDVYVLCAAVFNRIIRHADSTLIITYEWDCWGLVLKCYELRTRQHKMLNINALRPLKH